MNAICPDSELAPSSRLQEILHSLLTTQFNPGGKLHRSLSGHARPMALYLDCACPTASFRVFCAATAGMHRIRFATEQARPSPERVVQSERISLVLPVVHGNDPASVYRSADVVVSTCSCLGCIPKFIEALACGVPVAALPGDGAYQVLGSQGRGRDDHLPMTVGAVDQDLERAVACAMRCDRTAVAVAGAHLLAIAGVARDDASCLRAARQSAPCAA